MLYTFNLKKLDGGGAASGYSSHPGRKGLTQQAPSLHASFGDSGPGKRLKPRPLALCGIPYRPLWLTGSPPSLTDTRAASLHIPLSFKCGGDGAFVEREAASVAQLHPANPLHPAGLSNDDRGLFLRGPLRTSSGRGSLKST